MTAKAQYGPRTDSCTNSWRQRRWTCCVNLLVHVHRRPDVGLKPTRFVVLPTGWPVRTGRTPATATGTGTSTPVPAPWMWRSPSCGLGSLTFPIGCWNGAGGMGVVYFGFSTDGHRRAIKVPHRELAADAEFRCRFSAEVAAASKVTGPGVATVVAADTDADLPWLASEYVPGSPLGESADVPMGTDDARAFALGLAQALADIHAAGVVHRDLKPANILLTDTGPRVVDFGIATAGFTRLTSTGVIIGSPGWIAPERLKGDDATPASDVWAWGACVAYAFTGRPPSVETPQTSSQCASCSASPT